MKKVSILSVEASENWSWSVAIRSIINLLSIKYEFAHVYRDMISNNGGIDEDLIDKFDLVLAQNAGLFKYVKDKNKLVGRIGGIFVNDKKSFGIWENDIKSAAVIIVVNNEYADAAREIVASDKVYVIPNGVDLNLFKPYNSPLLSKRKFTVGFVGRITGEYPMYHKGWKYFVQATLRLRADSTIHVFSLLSSYNQLPHKQMPNYYNNIDCLVLPSIGEGCSNTVVEALACGVPVLLTETGFHGEMLTDGINCLFIKRDIDDIITKINMLKDSRELRATLSIQGRAFAEKYHDVTEIASKYDEVFKLTLERKEI